VEIENGRVFLNILVLSQCIPKVICEKVTRLSTIFVRKLIFVFISIQFQLFKFRYCLIIARKLIFVIIIIQFGPFKFSSYSIFVLEIIIVIILLLLTNTIQIIVFI